MSHYNYKEIFNWLQQKGRELYGNNFTFLKEDDIIIQKLAVWFLNDEEVATVQNIDLSKGILLTGPIGCGKTSLMNLMRYIAVPDRKFILRACRDISFEFIQNGYSVIHRYSKPASFGKAEEKYQAKIFCFDDLGVESNLKYYGNECNVMAEILLSRYDLFISNNIVTHLTTNLSATEIEEMYGNRVRSRMRQLFNLTAFDNNSSDKRK